MTMTAYAWLIELKASVSRKPTWYGFTEDEEEGLGITDDPLKAIRFARKLDAERVIIGIGWTEAFACEHGFDQ